MLWEQPEVCKCETTELHILSSEFCVITGGTCNMDAAEVVGCSLKDSNSKCLCVATSWLVSTTSSWFLWTVFRGFLKLLYVQKDEGHPCSPHFKRKFLAGYSPCWNFKCWQRTEQFLWCFLQTKREHTQTVFSTVLWPLWTGDILMVLQ